MWYLQIKKSNTQYLFHTVDAVAAYVLGQSVIHEYTLQFIPIWEAPKVSARREREDQIIPDLPEPLSR
jgi:hypothetical protein